MAVHAQVRFTDAEHKALKLACVEQEVTIDSFIKDAVMTALTNLGYEPKEKENNNE